MTLQHAVEAPKEGAAAPLEMLPRVFAIEDHRDSRLFPAGKLRKAPTGFGQAVDEIRRGGFGLPSGVDESNQIRQRVVAEQAPDFVRTGPNRVRQIGRAS